MDGRVVDNYKFETYEGASVQVVRRNPFGFLYFVMEKGGVIPRMLEGTYTSFGAVDTAIARYMANKPAAAKPEPEPIKTKSVSTKTAEKAEKARPKSSVNPQKNEEGIFD